MVICCEKSWWEHLLGWSWHLTNATTARWLLLRKTSIAHLNHVFGVCGYNHTLQTSFKTAILCLFYLIVWSQKVAVCLINLRFLFVHLVSSSAWRDRILAKNVGGKQIFITARILDTAHLIDELVHSERLLGNHQSVIFKVIRATRLKLQLQNARLAHLVLKVAQTIVYLIWRGLKTKWITMTLLLLMLQLRLAILIH